MSKSASDLLLASTDNNIKLKNAKDSDLEMLDNFLLAITGQNFENEQQVLLNYSKYMPLVIDVFGEYTIQEVMLAYKLSKGGKLTNYKGELFVLYRELNFASFSDVILAYGEYKKQELGQYIQNQKLFLTESEMTEQEKRKIEVDGLKQLLLESWQLAEQNKLPESYGVLLYDSLKERGIINLMDEEKRDIQLLAFEKVRENAEYERKESADVIGFRKWDNFIQSLTKKTDEVVRMSKIIALQYQIKNWIIDDVTFEQIQELIK